MFAVALGLVWVLALAVWYFTRHAKWRAVLEPCHAFPLLGDLPWRIASPVRFHEWLYSRFLVLSEQRTAANGRPTPRIWREESLVFGPCLIVADASLGQQLLREMGTPDALLRRHEQLHGRYQDVFGEALQNSWGHQWAWRRKRLAPYFNGKTVFGAMWSPLVTFTDNLMLNEIDPHARSGEPLHLVKKLQNATLAVMLAYSLGDTLESRIGKILRILSLHWQAFGLRIVLPKIFHEWFTPKEFKQAQGEYEEIVNAGFKTSKETGQGFLSALQLQEEKYTHDLLMSESKGLLFAAFETTAATISQCISYLVANPDAMRKAQEEVDRVLGSGDFTVASSSGLTYVTACFNESLRLNPPVDSNIFQVTRSAEILGVPVDERDVVGISSYACARDPAVFGKDANEFRPERYLVSAAELQGAEEATRLPQFGFSMGAHQCIGRSIAYLEARVILAKLLHRYEFQYASPSYKPGYSKDNSIPLGEPQDHFPCIVKLRGK